MIQNEILELVVLAYRPILGRWRQKDCLNLGVRGQPGNVVRPHPNKSTTTTTNPTRFGSL